MLIIFDDFESVSVEKYKNIYNTLPEKRKYLLNNKFSNIDKKICLIEYAILKRILKLNDYQDFQYNENGKPYLDGYRKFNVSHTDNILCIVISDNNVGIDIERIRDYKNDIAKMILNDNELLNLNNVLSEEKNKEFFKLYTRKESIIKCKGINMSFDFKTLLENNRMFKFNDIVYKNYIISICEEVNGN